jgi:hypothetical protein
MAKGTSVVNFARFRARRARQRLPLFDGVRPSEAPAPPALFPAPRQLDQRGVEHRQRMLAHLKASSGQS